MFLHTQEIQFLEKNSPKLKESLSNKRNKIVMFDHASFSSLT